MPKVLVKKKPIVPKNAPTTPLPKLIDTLCEALKKAGIEYKRDGWIDYCYNKEGKWVKEDPCEWVDITLKDKEGHIHQVHFYFHSDSAVLEDVQIFLCKKKKGYKNPKFVASTKEALKTLDFQS